MAVEPLPGPGPWIRAWGRETAQGIRVFGWQQPWAHRSQADHLPQDSRRGVLLVHGYLCNRGFWNPWMRRLRAAGVPFVAVSLGPPRAGLDEQMQGLHEAWQRLQTRTGVTPLMVGHSMGGLLIRRWLSTQPDAFALQQEVITLGSPHHGTALARLGRSQAARQMRLQSPLLQEIMRCETASRLEKFTCYWSVCDNVVFPASHATLRGARNIHVPGRAHIDLTSAPWFSKMSWLESVARVFRRPAQPRPRRPKAAAQRSACPQPRPPPARRCRAKSRTRAVDRGAGNRNSRQPASRKR